MKNNLYRLLLLTVVLPISIAASGCALGEEATIFLTTTQVKTQPSPVTVKETVTQTVAGNPPSPTVTVTNVITSTVPMVTTAPPPPASTVYLTTTVVHQGVSVNQITLPAEEILSTMAFTVCIEVQNVSMQDMECNFPIIIAQLEDEEYVLTRHVEFFIESGEAKTVCTEEIKLPVASYTVRAGELLREFYIIEGSGG